MFSFSFSYFCSSSAFENMIMVHLLVHMVTGLLPWFLGLRICGFLSLWSPPSSTTCLPSLKLASWLPWLLNLLLRPLLMALSSFLQRLIQSNTFESTFMAYVLPHLSPLGLRGHSDRHPLNQILRSSHWLYDQHDWRLPFLFDSTCMASCLFFINVDIIFYNFFISLWSKSVYFFILSPHHPQCVL